MISRRGFVLGAAGVAVAGMWGNGKIAHAMTEPMSKTILRKIEHLPQEEIVSWLKNLRGHPYVVQSGFDVTSVFRVRAGHEIFYVAGVNVENKELTAGTCAEEGAIAAAVTALGHEIEIMEGWIMGAPRGADSSDITCYPCGECRQRIAQYAAKEAPIHIIALDGERKDTKIRDELIPHAFSFRDLEHQERKASLSAMPPSPMEAMLYRTPEFALDDERLLAWLSGLTGDIRVSGRKEGAILRLSNGAYVAGAKIENAAYPSGTNAIAAAAAIMNARFGMQKITQAWLSGGIPSGVSLQILHQFAGADMQLHFCEGGKIVQKAALKQLLPAAPLF